MQTNIDNKAVHQPPHSKSEARRIEAQTGQELPFEEFQFSGDGKKAPITIKAKSQAEAIEAYEKYLTE